jgi:polyhydroxyalkanoate synthesis repressor PhaR
VVLFIKGECLSKEKEIIIKKYPNRRLYDTTTSRYITIDDLSEMVKKDQDFKVVDVKTGDDLTRITLTQIVLDHEMKGYNLIPLELIRQIIKFCDHPLNKSFTDYLTHSLEQYNNNYSNMQGFMKGIVSFDASDWTKQIEEMNRKNVDFFHNMFGAMNSTKNKK